MSNTMSMDEITERFDSEWVLLGDPQHGPSTEITAGDVVWHSPERDEVWRKALELRLTHVAVLYLGDYPDDIGFIL